MKRWIQRGALVAAALAAGTSLPLQDLLVAGTARAYTFAHRSAVQTAQSQLATLDVELGANSREAADDAVLAALASTDAERRGFDRKQRDGRSIQTALEAQRGQHLRKVRQLDVTSAQLIAETEQALGYPQVRPASLARRLVESQQKLSAIQSCAERAERQGQQRMLDLVTLLIESVESMPALQNESEIDCVPMPLTTTATESPDRTIKIRDVAK